MLRRRTIVDTSTALGPRICRYPKPRKKWNRETIQRLGTTTIRSVWRTAVFWKRQLQQTISFKEILKIYSKTCDGS